MSILTGQTSAQAPHKLEAKGSPGSWPAALELRSQYGADRTAVARGRSDPDAAIDWADIGTGATTDAVKRLPLLLVSENAAASVVEQQEVELFRTADLAVSAAS